MTLGMAKKRNRNKRIKYTDLIERNFKKKKNSTSMCDAFDMINRGNMYELGSNV